jgi:hypothetical protein
MVENIHTTSTDSRANQYEPNMNVRQTIVGEEGVVDVAIITKATNTGSPSVYRNASEQANIGETRLLKTNGGDFAVQLLVHDFVGPDVVLLKGFEPSDKIRFAEGEFTLSEIEEHGANTPMVAQAKYNAEALAEALRGQSR